MGDNSVGADDAHHFQNVLVLVSLEAFPESLRANIGPMFGCLIRDRAMSTNSSCCGVLSALN
jgi:hypothetical protein